MNKNEPIKFDLEDIKRAVIRKFPLISDAFSTVQFHEDSRVKTASTDGKDIFYSQEFMDSLTYDQQIFTIAHEGLHIAFEHVQRRENNHITGKRFKHLWNIATDAVINQALKGEGLPIKAGFVNISEALNQSADFMYEKLLKEYNKQKEEQKNNQSNPNGNSSVSQDGESDEQGKGTSGQGIDNSTNGQSSNSPDNVNSDEEEEQSVSDWANQFGDTFDDHDFWDQSEFESSNDNELDDNSQSKGKSKNLEDDKSNPKDEVDKTTKGEDESDKESEDQTESDKQNSGKDLEKDFGKKNKDKKQEISDQIMKKIQQQKDKAKDFGNESGKSSGGLGEVGESQSIYNWRKILRREFDDYIRQWSNRRANRSNGWSSRIASIYTYDKPRTEVLLDTSGSVDDELLKGFLRQLKPMLRDSDLYVGCFDTKFYGFTEIQSNKDIDNFIIKGRGGTNLDTAVRAFSKDDQINKVIFTDGAGVMPHNDLAKTKKLYWVIFDTQDFEPCCGRVLFAKSEDVRKGLKLFQENQGM